MAESKWWPSEEEYNPNISEEKWMELLQDREIFNEKSMCFMRRMLDIGGEATCADLSKKYGETAQGYVGIEQGVAGRIIKRLNLKKCPGDGKEYLFPVLFLGRAVDKNTDNNEGSYIWKLRPELHAALQKTNLEEFELYVKGENIMDKSVKKYIELLRENKNIILHGAPGTGKTFLAKQIAKAMNNFELGLTVLGFESFISEPDYLVKHDSSKGKETGTIQRYVQVAAKLLEKYKTFEYIADNAELLREKMKNERDESGKSGWDNNQIVVNHIKKYVEFARLENHIDTDDLIGFCQFHPSYDYTDFVEGLRPNKNNGFARKDGTFKEFCKKALQNLIDSKKSVIEIQTELSWQEKIKVFLDDAIENRTECPLKKNGYLIIESWHDDIVDIVLPGNESHKEDTIHISKLLKVLSSNKMFENAIEIERYLKGFHSAEYSYILAVFKKIKEYSFNLNTDEESVSKISPKNYVFTIDEINRGELSKIFGELFFSVDPGYRGFDESGKPKGLVKTQYQNLVDDDDVFSDGFFIPENVYIIGTMNDIDRSVESMDFAMRRRFTFVEVTAEESAENMNITGEALKKMNAINKVISKMPELGKSYCIGAAYFKDAGDLQKLWDLKISSLVYEYLRGIDNYTDEHKDGEKFNEIKSAYDNPDSVE